MNQLDLSQQDIEQLSHNLSIQNKANVAQKISVFYNGKDISERGQRLAEDIFRIMLEDVQIKVREALSESLKDCDSIPHDIVLKLINDQDSVATPFIKYYAHLTQEDLISIIEAQSYNKQKAVAERKDLPAYVSQYIVEKCPEEIVGVLISNERSNIVEKTYTSIIDKYGNNEDIKEHLVYRSSLPTSVIEKIVSSLSDELLKCLVTTHNLPNNIATDIVERVKEKTTLRISEEYSSDKQIEELVHQLYASNHLTSSLVVRAICMGDLKFFEYSLVYLSNTPLLEVRKILFNLRVDFMIRNLLRKAFIPKNMFPAVFSALNVIRNLKFTCQKSDRASFVHKVIERILSMGNSSDDLSEEDVKYLISKIS